MGAPYTGSTPGNSVRIFFQSHSSSSASNCESEVTVPCPISDLWISSVTVSSVPTFTKAFSCKRAGSLRLALHRQLEADEQSAAYRGSGLQETSAIHAGERISLRTSLGLRLIARGEMHRLADRLVGPAAAQVAAHGFVDIGIR